MFSKRVPRPEKLEKDVQAALDLLSTEEADAIIIVADGREQIDQIMDAVGSAMTMLWTLVRQLGVKVTPEATRPFSQATLVLLSLIHRTYALGIRRGREIEREGGGDYARTQEKDPG